MIKSVAADLVVLLGLCAIAWGLWQLPGIVWVIAGAFTVSAGMLIDE